jgi:hypothetical protein
MPKQEEWRAIETAIDRAHALLRRAAVQAWDALASLWRGCRARLIERRFQRHYRDVCRMAGEAPCLPLDPLPRRRPGTTGLTTDGLFSDCRPGWLKDELTVVEPRRRWDDEEDEARRHVDWRGLTHPRDLRERRDPVRGGE